MIFSVSCLSSLLSLLPLSLGTYHFHSLCTHWPSFPLPPFYPTHTCPMLHLFIPILAPTFLLPTHTLHYPSLFPLHAIPAHTLPPHIVPITHLLPLPLPAIAHLIFVCGWIRLGTFASPPRGEQASPSLSAVIRMDQSLFISRMVPRATLHTCLPAACLPVVPATMPASCPHLTILPGSGVLETYLPACFTFCHLLLHFLCLLPVHLFTPACLLGELVHFTTTIFAITHFPSTTIFVYMDRFYFVLLIYHLPAIFFLLLFVSRFFDAFYELPTCLPPPFGGGLPAYIHHHYTPATVFPGTFAFLLHTATHMVRDMVLCTHAGLPVTCTPENTAAWFHLHLCCTPAFLLLHTPPLPTPCTFCSRWFYHTVHI